MSANVAIETDPTMSAIRSILHEPAPSNAAPKLAIQTQEAIVASLHATGARDVEIAKAATPVTEKKIQLQESVTKPNKATLNKGNPNKGPLLGKLNLPFQVKRKHVVWIGFVVAVVLRPNWFLLTFVLSAILLLGAFAVFGTNKTWRAIMWGFNGYARRSPERAKRFAKRMDRAAMRWDGFLDRFPEGMVDGLYLPDFQSIQDADDKHNAVVDARLSRMHAEG